MRENPGMTRLSLAAAWVVVAAAATTLTWQIVSAADDQVSDRSVAALEVTSTAATPPTSSRPDQDGLDPSLTPDTSTTTTTTTTTIVPTTAPTTAGTTGTTPGSTTSSTVGDSPPAGEWKVETMATPGGTLVVSYRAEEVRYESASPLPGFSVQVEKAGPPEVEVEFEGPVGKVEVRVRWRDGSLSVETEIDAPDD